MTPLLVQHCAFAQVEAVDAGGNRPADGQVVGVTLPHASLEATAREHPLSLLLPAGEYTAYVTSSPLITTTFVVDGTTDDPFGRLRVALSGSKGDVGTIRLRLSE